METLTVMGQRAKTAAAQLAKTRITERNNALKAAADALLAKRDTIQAANAKDIEAAKKNQMKPAMIDRLTLTDARIEGMAEGLYQIVQLDDPIGEITSMKQRPNGLMIGKKKVPLGVIAIIYESRPNVTADAFGLTLKSGNAVILRGGSDAIHSNTAIVSVITESLKECGINPDAIQLVTDTDRALVTELMHMNKYIDVIIPRGGAGLIQNVVQNSTVPVIETGTGNCHIYVDEYADFKMAEDIIFNAKTQRIGVCNACESLVVHSKIAGEFIPQLVDRLKLKNVEIGVDVARKYRESAAVINCIGAHHGDEEFQTVEAVLVAAADAISAARPGARRETLENYLKRLSKLEEIAESFEGVEKCFAIQAGREIRVVVKPDKIDEAESTLLVRNIVKRIESELEYPGQIKVVIIRETRVVDYAK